VLAHGLVLVGCFCCTGSADWILAACSNACNNTSDDEHPEHAGLSFAFRSRRQHDAKNEQGSCCYRTSLSAKLVSNDSEHQHPHDHSYQERIRETSVD
jgi:hypothetical protein